MNTGSEKYPLGTVIAYGPDNKLATKLVVAIFKNPGHEEADELHRWITQAGDVRHDPAIGTEVTEFLKRHKVKQTLTYDKILGCPHEEGIDYPVGGTCPHCPFWANIDRFTHEPKESKESDDSSSARPKVGRNDPCPCGSGKKYKKCCGR